MASSIESRVPLLDDSVVEFAASMHSRWKVRDGIPKRVLRDAVQDLLPAKVLGRQDKRGLPTPFGIWIRGSLKNYAREVLTDPMLKTEGILASARVERLFQMHCAGGADLGGLLWRPFAVSLWYQNLRAMQIRTVAQSLNGPPLEMAAIPTS